MAAVGASGSFSDYFQNQGVYGASCVHTGPGCETCETCAAQTPKGSVGHVFWDELEKLKHQLVDKHGHQVGASGEQGGYAIYGTAGVHHTGPGCETCETCKAGVGHVLWTELEKIKHHLVDEHGHPVGVRGEQEEQVMLEPVYDHSQEHVRFVNQHIDIPIRVRPNDSDTLVSMKDFEPNKHVHLVKTPNEITYPAIDERRPAEWWKNAAEEISKRMERLRLVERSQGKGTGGEAVRRSDEYCAECAASTPRGSCGHIFWDELELQRHGWADQHGRHWNTSQGQDEVQLLHAGRVDCLGHHGSYGVAATGPDQQQNNSTGVVRFGPSITVSIPSEEPQQQQSDVDVSLLSDNPRDKHYQVDADAQLHLVKTNERRALQLNTNTQQIFLERSAKDGDGVLICAQRTSDGKWISSRLELVNKN